MADTVLLIGAEDVRRAANTIDSAADSLRHAASHHTDGMEMVQRRFSESVESFCDSLRLFHEAIERAVPAMQELTRQLEEERKRREVPHSLRKVPG